MKTRCASLFRILMVAVVALVTLPGSPVSVRGGPAANPNTNAKLGTGVPWDWAQRHVIFSNPGTAEEAQRNGTYDRWQKIANDPRYLIQQRRRSGTGQVSTAMLQGAPASAATEPDTAFTDEPEVADETSAPGSEEDFPGGVLPRGVARAPIFSQAQQSALRRESRERRGHRPPPRHRYRLRNRIHKDWNMTLGNYGTAGLGEFPAVFSTGGTNCSDFAVFNTSLPGSSSQADLVAFNNLYSSCHGGVPTVYWAYNTNGAVINSVVLSLDGTQVAFIQTDNTTTYADLVLLTWKSSNGTLTAPATPTSEVAGSYNGCTAPCSTTIALLGSPTDTYSSLDVDFSTNNAYVGDDYGMLHKFINIFAGGSNTPAEATSPWPVVVSAAWLGNPIYDPTSGEIFIGDNLNNNPMGCPAGGICGYLYSINGTSGTVTQSAHLDYNYGIYDAPLVDSTAGIVYAFVGADNSTNCSSGPCAAVFQFPVGFAANAPGTEETVGSGYEFMMSGAFDNQYFSASLGGSGNLYVVGGTGPTNNTLYAVPISGIGTTNTMGAAVAGPVVACNYTNTVISNVVDCTYTGNSYMTAGFPVTEFYNTNTSSDFIFVGVLAFGSQFTTNPCAVPSGVTPPVQPASEGCIMGFTAPAVSGTITSSTAPNGTLTEPGGPSGIVIDNGVAGASNIYFSTLANQPTTTPSIYCTGGAGGCAISATQSALQ